MATNETPVEFTLDCEEVQINLTQKGLATPRECILREMDGFERDQYLNSQRDKVEKSTQNLKDFRDVQTALIAQCLYDKATNEKIPITDIRKFPSKMQGKLYDICMTINGLNSKAEETAKNS